MLFVCLSFVCFVNVQCQDPDVIVALSQRRKEGRHNPLPLTRTCACARGVRKVTRRPHDLRSGNKTHQKRTREGGTHYPYVVVISPITP
ncbi:hypothetical protein BS47DRAFT_440296 [Hydnum rufescens UP504]|uniref:Secreted protein n=1 Tax=Hydnum rufescens UP504 TaxID=1448309 RepID=A0A9P6B4W0_9AGAM|nr:hypothetical protein BS47DRAFT_440296 [Hydnum rufescens UP504]